MLTQRRQANPDALLKKKITTHLCIQIHKSSCAAQQAADCLGRSNQTSLYPKLSPKHVHCVKNTQNTDLFKPKQDKTHLSII